MADCLESIEHLARQIAELARCVDRVKHAWIGRIREFDARNGWADTGCVSMVAWLSWWTGTSNKTASEHVRIARALGELALIDRAFASGELTYSKVRALTRAATPATQQTLLDVAKSATASQLDKIVAGLRRVRAHANPEQSSGEAPRRFARFTETPDGMVASGDGPGAISRGRFDAAPGRQRPAISRGRLRLRPGRRVGRRRAATSSASRPRVGPVAS
ncbi:DUF222 domain-containing protein [Nannocystaceae bacterium ST9]